MLNPIDFDDLHKTNYTHVGLMLSNDIFMGLPLEPAHGTRFEGSLDLSLSLDGLISGENIRMRLKDYYLKTPFDDRVFFIKFDASGKPTSMNPREGFELLFSLTDRSTNLQYNLDTVYFAEFHRGSELGEYCLTDLIELDTVTKGSYIPDEDDVNGDGWSASPIRLSVTDWGFELRYDSEIEVAEADRITSVDFSQFVDIAVNHSFVVTNTNMTRPELY